jgi:hypothetical protein
MLIIEKTADASGAYCKMEATMNSYAPVNISILTSTPEQEWNAKVAMELEARRLKRTPDEEARFQAYVRDKKWRESQQAYWKEQNKSNY